MKKFLAILLTVVFILSFMLIGSACKQAVTEETSTEEETTEEITAEVAEEETTEEATEEVELTWLQWWEGELPIELLDEVESRFEEAHPGVTIKRENVPYPQYFDKLMVMTQANELPDVIGMTEGWISSLVSQGGYEPLDTLLEEEGLIDQFAFFNRYDGKIWDVGYYGGSPVQFVNKKIFEDAGLDYPKTWDELLDVSRKLTDPAKNQYATCFGFGGPEDGVYYWFEPVVAQAGSRIVDENGNLVYNDENGVKALEFLGTFYNEKLLLPGELNNGAAQATEAFVNGNLALIWDGPWSIGTIKEMGADLEFDVIKMPAGPVSSGSNEGGAAGFSLGANSKNKEMAWEFIKFLTVGDASVDMIESRNGFSIYLPNLELPYIQEDPKLSACAEQMMDAGNIDVPVIEGTMDWQRIVTTEIQKYLSGEKTAQQALDDSISEYQDSIKR